MSDLVPPTRRCHVLMDIHADDWPTLLQLIEEACDRLDEGSGAIEVTSGGVSGGFHIEFTEDESMTAEKYQAALTEYLATTR